MFVYSLALLAPKSTCLCGRSGLLLCGAFSFPYVHLVWCWSTHSSTNFLLACTLLLFWCAHKQFLLVFSRFLCFFAVCGGFSPTAPNSGAQIVGGVQMSEKTVFPFFYLFSVSFSCFFFEFH